MAEALYRKYRSKNLDEVVGQEHVTTTLKNALKSGKISHAYLLTGPRGTGKTSIARILAHAVNDLPYSEAQHLDIIEIDAASNRRIDEVREIRDKVRIAPTSAKYKVYIIDEVHMLTKEAFNALLKTLEEPPQHAIFILATTEVHKLPETIISRTQRFNLKPIDNTVVVKHLADLAKREKIEINKDALQLIAEHSGGGLRDAISMLDQLSARSQEITKQDVEHMLGVAPAEAIEQLARVLDTGSPQDLLQRLTQLEEQGVHAPQLAHQLSEYIQQSMIAGSMPASSALTLLHKLLAVPAADNPVKSLELILLDYSLNNSKPNPQPEPIVEVAAPESVITAQPEAVEKPAPKPKPIQTNDATLKTMDNDQWKQILQAVKQKHNTLYGIVRMAEPKIEGNNLTLCFAFPFHQKRMSEAKNRELIQDVVQQVTGQNMTIICIARGGDTAQPSKDAEARVGQSQPNSGTLDTITDIFGGGELLES